MIVLRVSMNMVENKGSGVSGGRPEGTRRPSGSRLEPASHSKPLSVWSPSHPDRDGDGDGG